MVKVGDRKVKADLFPGFWLALNDTTCIGLYLGWMRWLRQLREGRRPLGRANREQITFFDLKQWFPT